MPSKLRHQMAAISSVLRNAQGKHCSSSGCTCREDTGCRWKLYLLCSLLRGLPKVDDILAGVCEKLLAKALEVAVNQRQHACVQALPVRVSHPFISVMMA